MAKETTDFLEKFIYNNNPIINLEEMKRDEFYFDGSVVFIGNGKIMAGIRLQNAAFRRLNGFRINESNIRVATHIQSSLLDYLISRCDKAEISERHGLQENESNELLTAIIDFNKLYKTNQFVKTISKDFIDSIDSDTKI